MSRQCVQDWVKDRQRLEQAKDDRQTAVRKRRHVPRNADEVKGRGKYPHIEAEVVSWIADLRQKGVTVSGGSIKRYAKKVYDKHYPEEDDFHASNGWLSRFTSRHGLTSRSVTSQGQKVPSDAKCLAENFFQYTRND